MGEDYMLALYSRNRIVHGLRVDYFIGMEHTLPFKSPNWQQL